MVRFKLVTVLYFSIFDVFWLQILCGADGDASFAPQANPALIRVSGCIYVFICLHSLQGFKDTISQEPIIRIAHDFVYI